MGSCCIGEQLDLLCGGQSASPRDAQNVKLLPIGAKGKGPSIFNSFPSPIQLFFSSELEYRQLIMSYLGRRPSEFSLSMMIYVPTQPNSKELHTCQRYGDCTCACASPPSLSRKPLSPVPEVTQRKQVTLLRTRPFIAKQGVLLLRADIIKSMSVTKGGVFSDYL